MNAGTVANGRVSHKKYKIVACSNEKESGSIPSLPEEIIFCILVWLPADVLYNSMRYVCRQWYNIIRNPLFIKEHLFRCTTGLFIQENKPRYRAQFADLRKMNVAVKEVQGPFPNTVEATSDGLVLYLDEQKTIYVANPLTKQRLIVPSLSWPSGYPPFFSFSCARSTMECKVVCTYRSNGCDVFKCMMITLGKEKAWKLINTNTFSDPSWNILRCISVSIEGFLYWGGSDYPNVVALDVESEMFYEFPRPAVQSKTCGFYYVPRGKSLSCMVRLIPGTLFDVFVLSDPMSGEWRKLYKIDFDAQKCRLSGTLNGLFSWPAEDSFFIPIAWVNNGEVFFCLFDVPGPYIGDDVKSGKTFIFESYGKDAWHNFWSDYAYSLVSLTV